MPNSVATITAGLISSSKPEESAYEIRDTKIKGLVLRVQPSGHKSLNYEYRIHGRKKRKSLGSAAIITLSQARAKAIQIQHFANDGIDVNHRARIERASTLGAFIENDYTDYAKGTILSFENIRNRLCQNFGHLYDRPMAEISVADIKKWRAGKKVKFQTVIKELAYLKSVINLAIKLDIIESHPLVRFQFERTEKDIADLSEEKLRYLSRDEEARLRTALMAREERIRVERQGGNRWRSNRGHPEMPTFPEEQYVDAIQPIVMLALLTGLRQGDIFTLEWKDIDENQQTITKQINKTRRHKPRKTTLQISDGAARILAKWKKSSSGNGLVFPSPITGKCYNNIYKAFNTVLKEAEIDDFRFHDLRHTFASWLAIGGVDLYTIQRLMTHSDLKMTQRYAHLSPDHMRDALDKVFGLVDA